MKRINAVLLSLAAMLLCGPALLVGSYGYAGSVLVAFAASYALGRAVPAPRFATLLLLLHAGMTTAALLVGVHPACAATALLLCLFAWNAAHQFAPTESATAAPASVTRLATQTLLRWVPLSLTLGIVLAVLPCLRI